MDSGSKQRILLIITNSYAATNVIHSGLIKPLAEQYDVYIISDLIHHTEIVKICGHFNVKIQLTDVPVPTESLFTKILRQLEKALFFHFFNIKTQKIREKQKSIWYHLTIIPILNLINFLGLSTRLLQFLRIGIIALTRNEHSLKGLNNYNFYGVISSSPLDIRENIIVNFMKKSNISSLAMIISWDNLTSKGIINADHDYILVWNEMMQDEYRHFYSIFNSSNQNVCITGIPRFDVYFKDLPADRSISEFRKRFDISAHDKVILFTTSALSHFPNQTDIVEHLLDYISQKENIKIIVRCHAADDYKLYKKFLCEPNLRIWYPGNSQDRENRTRIPELDILNSLAEMLTHCNVCLNIASTIRLEAAVCNKPGISIAYDGNSDRSFYYSIQRFYSYSHQIPLNDLEVDKLVFSKNELFHGLDKTLSSSYSLPEYTEKLKKFTFHSGPYGVSTTMKYLYEWLNS